VNARDAMPKGGKLTIVCRNETDEDGLPRTLPPGDYARVSISDTGEGMSETTRARAMDPFFTTKGVGKGTGLGLSMVQGMTAQTGGAMEIQSELGKGTTITLWLPQAGEDHIADMPAPAAARQNQQTDRKLRVLLVDDDPLVSLNTASLLMDLGHRVLEANSALHALELLDTDTAFDLVISDYAMPGMNGLDLALRIRENRREIPIILATGYAELPVSMPMEFPRLNKPYSQEDLRSALDRALPAPPS
jgi:CheY-like chemotaxis protein